mmetsp:Transcript_32475/g.76416  ORF Transcript_32475/g.76416 Transcript_32475/m.76416 type:complete len:137 (+) Transcript_32475:1-411(+)
MPFHYYYLIVFINYFPNCNAQEIGCHNDSSRSSFQMLNHAIVANAFVNTSTKNPKPTENLCVLKNNDDFTAFVSSLQVRELDPIENPPLPIQQSHPSSRYTRQLFPLCLFELGSIGMHTWVPRLIGMLLLGGGLRV